MINIYFAGAIRGGRQDSVWYKIIIEILGQHGHVFTEHVGSENLIYGEKGLHDRDLHDRDLIWIRQCQVLIAEVTVPSLGVGYEIGRAVAYKKPIQGLRIKLG